MWYCILTMLLLQVRQTYVTDINGNRVATGEASQQQSAGESSTRTESLRDINGRQAPLDRVEEKVLQDDGKTRVLERTIRHFDPNGNPGEMERVRVEESKNADGTKNVNTAVYRSDINGSVALAEQAVSESAKTGSTITTNTTVTRPAIDGVMRVAERRAGTVVQGAEGVSSEDVVVYRPNDNGQFVPAARTVTERREKQGEITEDSLKYQLSESGKLEPIGRNVTQIVKSGGAEVKEVTVYGTASPGKYASGKPQVREQQRVEKRITADGAVEVFSVRRPELDSQKLGEYQKVSEQVCSGSCKN